MDKLFEEFIEGIFSCAGCKEQAMSFMFVSAVDLLGGIVDHTQEEEGKIDSIVEFVRKSLKDRKYRRSDENE